MGQTVLDDGGVIVEILASKLGAAPTMADLQSWINTYGLVNTTVMDPPGSGTVTLDTYGIRESAFIVDLNTMQILVKINGSVAGVGESSVAQAIPMLLTLLGH